MLGQYEWGGIQVYEIQPKPEGDAYVSSPLLETGQQMIYERECTQSH